MTRKMLFFYSLLSLMSFSPMFLSILCFSRKPTNESVHYSLEGDKGQIGETSENLTTSFRGPLVELSN